MPYFGIGLHILIALFFAIHAVRSGQQIFWLLILFSFPLLGSIVYFLVVYLPDSRLQRGAAKVVTSASKVLDPNRALREARAAFDLTPTAQNQMRLASALLDAGQAEAAADNYADCLNGPFGSDLEIRLGAARACFACARLDQALTHLRFIRQNDEKFNPEPVSLLLTRSYVAQGQRDAAKSELESALARFGSFESKAEYAIWAATFGEMELAARMQLELQSVMKHWSRHTREMNLPMVRRLDEAFKLAKKSA